jgi:hypothetical protein
MPAFNVTAAEDWVRIDVVPARDDVTSSFGPLVSGQGVTFEGGSAADADCLTVICTGRYGPPALTLAAGEPDIVFQVAPAPTSGPAVFGPMQPDDAPASVPAGDQGTEMMTYTVTAMTADEARSKGLIT